jgi:hypothetical protein
LLSTSSQPARCVWISPQDFRFENLFEFSPDTLPLRYWDGANPAGASFSDPSPSLETARDHEWWVVSGDAGTFLQAFAVPQEWSEWGIVRGTVFRPSTGDGAHAAGFSLLNMTRLQEPGVYQMRQATVVLPRPYRPGDEAEALAMVEAPLLARPRRMR